MSNKEFFKIVMGADHGGVGLKSFLHEMLVKDGWPATDLGSYDCSRTDYPDIAKKVVEAVLTGEAERGILVCGSGIGMSIAANRFRGIRAALCHDEYTARMSRAHNDANVLVLGERVTGAGVAEGIVKVWLATPFEGGRHLNRIEKIEKSVKQ